MNNTLQKLDVTQKKKLKKETKQYIEFDYMEDNDYIITIEYCSNCEEHSTHTQHSSELFHNYATYLQRSIIMRYPFIKVLLKPIDTDINKDFSQTFNILEKTKIIDEKYKEVRLGAMEVFHLFMLGSNML